MGISPKSGGSLVFREGGGRVDSTSFLKGGGDTWLRSRKEGKEARNSRKERRGARSPCGMKGGKRRMQGKDKPAQEKKEKAEGLRPASGGKEGASSYRFKKKKKRPRFPRGRWGKRDGPERTEP